MRSDACCVGTFLLVLLSISVAYVAGSPVLSQPALSSTVLSDDTSRDLGSWIADILHEFPHISYRLQLVGDRFDPSESEYLQSVSTFAVPFACLGALLFVVGSAYAIYRCACTDPNAEYRYQKWHRTFFRVALVFLTFLMILACGPGIWGSVEVTRSGPDIADRIQESTDFLVDNAEGVNYSIIQLSNYLNGTYSSASNALSNAYAMQSDLNEYKDHMLTAELVRNIVVVCLFGGIVLACTLGLLAALFGWGAPSLMMVFMLWLLLSFAWFMCGVHMSTAVGVADVCETGDDFFTYNYFKSNESVAFVKYYMFCNSSMPYENLQADGRNLFIRANESYYEALANNNTEEAQTWLQVRNQTQELLGNVAALADCSRTSSDYAESKDRLCSDVIVGLSTMVGMWIFIGLLGLAAMPIGVAGYKQFPLPLWYEEFGSELVLTREEKNYYPELAPINFD